MQNSGGSLLLLVLFIGMFYLLVFLPQQRARRRHQQLISSLALGDEIFTFGGLVGIIRRFDGEMVSLELSPGVEARVLRSSVRGKLQQPPAEEMLPDQNGEDPRPT